MTTLQTDGGFRVTLAVEAVVKGLTFIARGAGKHTYTVEKVTGNVATVRCHETGQRTGLNIIDVPKHIDSII